MASAVHRGARASTAPRRRSNRPRTSPTLRTRDCLLAAETRQLAAAMTSRSATEDRRGTDRGFNSCHIESTRPANRTSRTGAESDNCRSSVVPPAGFEPALPPPEGGALSPELRGPYVDNPSAPPLRVAGAPRWSDDREVRVSAVDPPAIGALRTGSSAAEARGRGSRVDPTPVIARCGVRDAATIDPGAVTHTGLAVAPWLGLTHPAQQVRRLRSVCGGPVGV